MQNNKSEHRLIKVLWLSFVRLTATFENSQLKEVLGHNKLNLNILIEMMSDFC